MSYRGEQVNKEQTMREQLVELVQGMLKQDFDFSTPPVFQWRYEEIPNFEFKLLIKPFKEEEYKEPISVDEV